MSETYYVGKGGFVTPEEKVNELAARIQQLTAERDQLEAIADLAAKIHASEPETIEEYDERTNAVAELQKLLSKRTPT